MLFQRYQQESLNQIQLYFKFIYNFIMDEIF